VADHPFIFIGQLTVYVFIACVALLLIARARIRKARPTPGIQLSSDRRWWWDGQTWRDAERDVPLTAARSADGLWWWDGAAWRTVPNPPTQASSEP